MTALGIILVVSASYGQTAQVTYSSTIATGIEYPARLAPGPSDGFYVTDPPKKLVVQYDSAGAVVNSFTISQRPEGIAMHSDGRVFVSRGDGAVGIYSSAFVAQGTVNAAPETMVAPRDLEFFGGELYVVDSGANKIFVFTESVPGTWTLARFWGMTGSGLGQLQAPQALAIDPVLGRVIVTDVDNFRVQVFMTDGTVLFKFGYRILFSPLDERAWFARSEGVAVDECSNIYISDALMGTVRVFDRNGKELGTTHTPVVAYGTGTGQLRVPCDVMIKDGTLFVANTNNAAVEVFDVQCTGPGTVAATAAPSYPEADTEPSDVLHRIKAVPRKPDKGLPEYPDDPTEIVDAMHSGEFVPRLDLNQDKVINVRDLKLAVAAFGAGTVDDFLARYDNAADHSALDSPHIIDIKNRCGRCHSMDGSPGGTLLAAAGQENLCQSCHSAGKIGGAMPVAANDTGMSHPWGVPASNPPAVPGPAMGSDLLFHLDSGNIRCATCHEPHESFQGSCSGENLAVTPPVTGQCVDGPFNGKACWTDAQCELNYLRTTGSAIDLCSKCHTEYDEWLEAGHSHEDADPFSHYNWTASNRASCRQCHSGDGYIDFSNGKAAADQRGTFRVVDCLVCHATHGKSQDQDLLRIYDTVTIPSGQTFTDVGPSATCIACHNGRRQPPIPNPPGVTTIHYLSGGVMLEGVNGVTLFDGVAYTVPNSNHTTNSGVDCTSCHMAPGPTTGPAVGKVGGHTFKLVDHVSGFENVGNTCNTAGCHSGLTTINRTANGDYDGNGFIEGVQTETRGLLDLLEAALNAAGAERLLLDPVTGLPTTDPNGAPANPYWGTSHCVGGSRDGDVCTGTGAGTAPFNCPSGTCTQSVLPAELATVEDGIWNYEYVKNSGDYGIKNTGYAVGLLQIAYKGVTNTPVPNAAYRYQPAP